MRRLSTSALAGVRRAVDESDELRRRVAAAAPTEEDAGGRAPWLYLHRPEGWDDELRTLGELAAARSVEASDAAEERTARRRLQAVEEELKRVRVERDDARRAAGEASASVAELAEERRRRAEFEAEVDRLRERVVAVERERDAAHRRASAADKALAEATRRDDADGSEPDGGVDVDVDAVRSSVEAARAAAAVAVEALGTALEGLAPEEGLGRRGAKRRADERRRLPVGARLPAPLPPGVLADDPTAADHLVRLPGAVLLVDGYNLSLRRWDGLPLGEQRGRLVDALQALAARTGVEVEVVFDGDDDAGQGLRSSGGGRRGQVRVTFSAASTEADDVLLELVDLVPSSRAVVVATDDRRVQREAAGRGANVVGSAALFAVLGLRG